MKNFLKLNILIALIILLAGCEKDEIAFKEDFEIKFGSECGWCAGQEFITINSSKMKYVRNIPCGDKKGTTQKERQISADEWVKITSSFDYSLFKTLKYTECNVCADGCDEIITITKNSKSHELRYSASDEIEGMNELRQILTELIKEMREAN